MRSPEPIYQLEPAEEPELPYLENFDQSEQIQLFLRGDQVLRLWFSRRQIYREAGTERGS